MPLLLIGGFYESWVLYVKGASPWPLLAHFPWEGDPEWWQGG